MLLSQGRLIDYIRVSVTDRCNLRCKYCMPEDLPFIPHDRILRYEEILRICGIFAKLGVRIVKVTGGEPLTRKGCVEFIRDLKMIPGIEHVTLTTNGVLLEPYIDDLVVLGLDCVNISLDSLDPGIYERITGRDEFARVWSSLHKALDVGLRVKINNVPMRGVNDGEILAFAKLAETLPLDIRFIEQMPSGDDIHYHRVPAEEVLDMLSQAYPDLTADAMPHGFGPARYFKSAGLKGAIGLIDAISNHFCAGCNRLRLTSEGFLKLCLYYDDGLDLRGLVRGGASDDEIEAAIIRAVAQKPERHAFGSDPDGSGGIGTMSRIGG